MKNNSPNPHYHCLKPPYPHAQRLLIQSAVNSIDYLMRRIPDPEPYLVRIVRVNRRVSGMTCRYISAGGIRWPYLCGGRGAPVVLLHGFGADKDRFGPLPSYLRRWFHVVIPDLSGFGDHVPDWQAVYDVPGQVERLQSFFRELGLEHFHLLGISLGGYVAALYAARFPQRVKSLILMNTAGISSPLSSEVFMLFEQHDQNIFLYTNEEQVQKMIDYLMYRPIQLPLQIRRYWAARGRQTLFWRRKMFADLLSDGIYRLDEYARDIQAPTRVIWGRQDRICHVSAVDRLLETIKDCQAFVIDSCGHIPLFEYPGICLRLCREFLFNWTPNARL